MVNEFETHGLLDLVSRCQQGANRAGIIDNGYNSPAPVFLGFLFPRLRMV